MCNPNTPSVSLQTAVIMQIQEFAQKQTPFSRYDITTELRRKCNDGELDIPECKRDPNSDFCDVRKTAVDDIFEQLWNNGLCDGIPALVSSYDRNRGYRLFSGDTTTQGSAIPAPSMVAPSPVTNTPSSVTTIPTNQSVVSVVPPMSAVPRQPTMVTLSDAEIRRRIDLYMTRCQKVGMIPSLKQIQSAIKRGNRSTGLSYREIANVAGSLGYKV